MFGGRAPADLSDQKFFRFAACEIQNLHRDTFVEQDHIGGLQRPHGAQCQQFGIAGAGADKEQGRIMDFKSINKNREYVIDNACLGPIRPRSIMKLDEDMVLAMKKMQKINKIKAYLPGIDCAACGSPSCRTLAEDVVQGRSRTSDCVFVAMKVKGGDNMSQVVNYAEETWGKDRFRNMLPE